MNGLITLSPYSVSAIFTRTQANASVFCEASLGMNVAKLRDELYDAIQEADFILEIDKSRVILVGDSE